jgi:hypothetical protein
MTFKRILPGFSRIIHGFSWIILSINHQWIIHLALSRADSPLKIIQENPFKDSPKDSPGFSWDYPGESRENPKISLLKG